MKDSKFVIVGFHAGNQLARNAKYYLTVMAVLAELVQNAIDVGARKIEVSLNLKRRLFTVTDDGNGVSTAQFQEKLENVALSSKIEEKFGQFGLGFFSPLGKCREFWFTSVPKSRPGDGYTEFQFVSKDILASKEVRIPQVGRPDITHESQKSGGVWWRSQVKAEGLISDRTISQFSVSSFAEDLAVKYGEVIRKNRIEITIIFTDQNGETETGTVEVSEFSGTPLPVYQDTATDAGKVTATLYLARRQGQVNGRKGNVLFAQSGKPFNLSCDQFTRCTAGIISPEVINALRCGVFEGRVTAEKVVLNPDRERFERNDPLSGLCLALEAWFTDSGKALLEEAREEERDTRFQDLGTQAMAFAQQLLREKQYAELAQSFEVGTIGKGHKEKSGAKTEEKTSVSAAGLGGPPSSGDREPDGGKTPKKDHPKQRPGTVYGPRGKRRSEVIGDSTGLRFEVCEFDNLVIPFGFDTKTGTISINMRHRDFEACEAESDMAVVGYHVLIAQSAFDLYRYAGKSEFEVLERFVFQHLSTQVFGMLNAKPILNRAKKQVGG